MEALHEIAGTVLTLVTLAMIPGMVAGFWTMVD